MEQPRPWYPPQRLGCQAARPRGPPRFPCARIQLLPLGWLLLRWDITCPWPLASPHADDPIPDIPRWCWVQAEFTRTGAGVWAASSPSLSCFVIY